MEPFWETVPLSEMSPAQWESLCDGCGKCCLLKLEDADTGEVAYTRLHCRLLDPDTARCSDYADRFASVPDCLQLTPEALSKASWLPESCSYRRVAEGRGLPDWHHLVCGDRTRVVRDGHSVAGRTVSEDTVLEADQIDWIVDWEGNPP